MSGECDRCGEHTLDCRCRKKMNNVNYLHKRQAKMERIAREYYPDLQVYVQDIHKDIFNKFSEFGESEKNRCATHVMESLLFYEICRIITPYSNVRDWKKVFRGMEDQCVQVCKHFYDEMSGGDYERGI